MTHIYAPFRKQFQRLKTKMIFVQQYIGLNILGKLSIEIDKVVLNLYILVHDFSLNKFNQKVFNLVLGFDFITFSVITSLTVR